MGTLNRPAVPPPVRIRRDINNLAANDPIITFYERAIERMQQGNRIDLPTSWRYQAAIHDYPDPDKITKADRQSDPQRRDPFAQDGEALPSAAERRKFWGQCQHHGWFFLPWHRAYLHFFEKIIMKIVAGMEGGPKDWALPYWNYSSSVDAAKLPGPFRNATIPDPLNAGRTKPNHLFVSQRVAAANAGGDFLGAADVDRGCLRTTPFGDGLGGFGGNKIDHHSFIGGGPEGALEGTPHDAVHGAIGASGGFMGGFVTAPLDPIFWLHHCNIDRLWEIWVQRQKQLGNLSRNPNPDTDTTAADKQIDGTWQTLVFDLHDADGNPVTITSKDVLNTRVAPLSYEYEDTNDPFNGAK